MHVQLFFFFFFSKKEQTNYVDAVETESLGVFIFRQLLVVS